MTTPSIDIDLDLIMPWSATGKFPDTTNYRRAEWTGSVELQPGVTDIQVTWDGEATLNLFLSNPDYGSLVPLDTGIALNKLVGKKQYLIRAVMAKKASLVMQGYYISEADLAKTLGMRFMPTPTT